MKTTHDVTKLLSSTLTKYWKCGEPEIYEATMKVVEALDTDLEALEYGQSDELGDKMAGLEAIINEIEELDPEDVVEVIDPAKVAELEETDPEDESEEEDDNEPAEPIEDDDEDEPKPL